MDALGVGQEDDVPPRPPGTEVPVGLLAEQEEALVGEPELGERGPSDEHARTHDGLDDAHLVVVEAAGVERVQRGRARRELAQTEILGRQAPERREATNRPLQGSVRVREARRDERCGRAGVRAVDQRAKRVTDEPGIGVQEKHVTAVRLAEPGVPPRGEAAVLGLDHLDLGKALTDEGDRAVASIRCRRRSSGCPARFRGTARSRAARRT